MDIIKELITPELIDGLLIAASVFLLFYVIAHINLWWFKYTIYEGQTLYPRWGNIHCVVIEEITKRRSRVTLKFTDGTLYSTSVKCVHELYQKNLNRNIPITKE